MIAWFQALFSNNATCTAATPGLPRKSLRRASASVQRLRRVIGPSKVLYLGVVAHCGLLYAEHSLVVGLYTCENGTTQVFSYEYSYKV